MAENQDGIIHESDLFQADGTIDNIIGKIDEMNESLGSLSNNVKQTAASLSATLSKVSGATEGGRKSIEKLSENTAQLTAVERELKSVMSELGRQTEILKNKTNSTNKVTASQKQILDTAVSAYAKISSEIKELAQLYDLLNNAERNEAGYGVAILSELREKAKALREVQTAVQPVITEMSALAKAEKELKYWQSAEGQALLALKAEIKEVKKARVESKQQVTALEKAQRNLTAAKSDEALKTAELNAQTKYEITLRKLQAAVSTAAEGSYYSLVAQYNLATFQLRNMTVATEEDKVKMDEMMETVKRLRAQIQLFNENIGDYSYSMGDMKQAFAGVSFQVQQVVRELPAAAVSLNTFFLAISNNIPMLVDEIQKFKAAGNSSKDVIKKIAKSLFSWQTALVVALAVFSKFGKQVVQFVSQVILTENATQRLARVTKELNNELKSTNADYGSNILKVRQLADAYKELNSEQSKVEWIKAHEDDWRQLNVQVNDALDFEKKFIDNSADMQKAFKQRALAAAAEKLMTEKYNEVLKKQIELETTPEKIVAPKTTSGAFAPGDVQTGFQENPVYAAKKKEISNLMSDIELLYGKFTENMTASTDFFGTSLDGSMSDLTTYLNNMNLKILKKYETAQTKLVTSEIEKRTAEVEKEYSTESVELQNMIDSLDNKLNDSSLNLTDTQKEQIKILIDDAKEALLLYEDAFEKQMDEIAVDTLIMAQKTAQKANELMLDYAIEGSEEEKNARLKILYNQMQIELLENSKLIESEKQDENEIRKKYQKKALDIENEWNIRKLEIQEEGISLKLESITKGSEDELSERLKLLDKQQEIELAQNKLLAENERKDEKAITDKYDKMRKDATEEYYINLYNTKADNIQKLIDLEQKGSKKEYNLTVEQLDLQYQAAIKANKLLAKELQLDEEVIKAYYDRLKSYASGNYTISTKRAETSTKEQNMVENRTLANVVTYGQEGSRKRDLFEISNEIADTELQLQEYEAGNLQLSTEQVASLNLQNAKLKEQKKQLEGINGIISDIADGGIVGGILGSLGFNSDAVDAFQEAIDSVKESLGDLYEAEVELAEKEAELAEERVSLAQSALDAELEARANGYANDVAQARKDLELEKKKQKEKNAILAEAQRKQERIDSLTQVSSLVTASAELWKTFSPMGAIGVGLALAAIGTMFGSYIATKAKARQSAQQTYGEGGLEILEGGSHASGNDIDLHTRNSKGKNMRAEGGEALAIINKRNTKRYRSILPDVINSLNDGTFQDKFINAFNTSGVESLIVGDGQQIDLSTLESDVRGIRRQNESRTYILADGSMIIQDRNVKRIVKKS